MKLLNTLLPTILATSLLTTGCASTTPPQEVQPKTQSAPSFSKKEEKVAQITALAFACSELYRLNGEEYKQQVMLNIVKEVSFGFSKDMVALSENYYKFILDNYTVGLLRNKCEVIVIL